MESCKCCDLGIPQHLHQNSREDDKIFLESELIFRRFMFLDQNQKQTLQDGKLSASVFSTSRMSFNRDKYCEDPTDVLYNTESKDHFHNAGIISLLIKDINAFEQTHPNDQTKNYQLKTIHSPHICMYPHMEILIDLSGELLDELKKPPIIKTAIKEHYRRIATIVKLPSSPH